MTSGNSPQDLFLRMIFPWDDAHSSLYKSVTWSFIPKSGEKAYANFAAQGYADLVRLIQTRSRQPAADTYVALGLQKMASVEKYSNDGYPKAVRRKTNIVSLNSIFLDIDVGKDDAYATTDDAFNALDDFIEYAGLPETSMEVLSGTGGIHAYWCTDEPMPLVTWLPLATALRNAARKYGLKFDPQCTVNPAQILRVPDTFNHKRVPPVRVSLMDDCSFARYRPQQLAHALEKFAGPDGLTAVPMPNAAPQRPMSGINAALAAGVGERSAPPVAIDDVAVECGVISDILDRGGDGDSEPLWNLALYLASFTSDPHDAAHRLSDGYKNYSYEDTERKLAEKTTARAQNPSAGWPSCASFDALHPACQACRHFAAGKSPLNFATPQVTPPVGAPTSHTDNLVPEGYWRDANNNVFTVAKLTKGGDDVTVNVLNYPVLDAGIDDVTGQLVFRTVVSGAQRWGMVPVAKNLQATAIATALASSLGVFVKPKHFDLTREFIVAWMTHLQNIKKSMAVSNYGWTKDGKGFTFDQTTYLPAGEKKLAYRGETHDQRFSVKGDLKPWQAAMPLVYGNLPLETLVATAFAAPLVELIAPSSLVLSLYSHASGVGKSTAMQLAQSVWGDPRTGMSSLDDTVNSVMKKVADLKNLPVYWDELHTEVKLKQAVTMIFSVTQGKAKSRLGRDIKQQAAPAFTTMFCVASNHGVENTIYSETEGTEAGGMRVFEIEAHTMPPSGMTTMDSSQLLLRLQNNYGSAGAIYAQYIVDNKATLHKTMLAVAKRLNDDFNFQQRERFWSFTMTALIVGAMAANNAGLTRFDVARLYAYLGQQLARLRRTAYVEQSYTAMGTVDDALAMIMEMIADCRRENMIMTNQIPYTANPLPVRLVGTDMTHLRDIWLQVGQDDGRIRARVRPFNDWMRKRRHDPKHILKLLSSRYVVSQGKRMFGQGVMGLSDIAAIGRTECYDLTPLTPPVTSPGANLGSS